MTNTGNSSIISSLSSSLENAWELLSEGATNRRSPLHTPALATVTAEGIPRQRIMVLRAVDRGNRRLRFHTDGRTSKIADIQNRSAVSVLGYHGASKVQLRLTGSAEVQTSGPDADAAWQKASLYGQRCYLAEPAPGSRVDAPTSGLDPAIEGIKPTPEQVIPGRAHFAILEMEVQVIEWLFLAHGGHRRAIFHWRPESGHWEGSWLVP